MKRMLLLAMVIVLGASAVLIPRLSQADPGGGGGGKGAPGNVRTGRSE